MGIVHDSTASCYNHHFRQFLGNQRFALGDPGFAGVRWMVAGYKTNQLNTEEKRIFDRISRSEQVLVEQFH